MIVSVVIPTFNRSRTVLDSVSSVMNQTFDRLEILVVDDGSTDNTSDVIRAIGDPRVTYMYQPNRGPSAARNLGVDAASGEIVMFLDSDDTWKPSKIESQVALLERWGPAIACSVTNAEIISDGEPTTTSFAKSGFRPLHGAGLLLNPHEIIPTRFFLFNQVVAFRRAALHTVRFDERYRFLEDYDLALQASLLGPWVYTKDILVTHNKGREDSLSQTANADSQCLYERLYEITERFLDRKDLPSSMRRALLFNRAKLRVAMLGTGIGPRQLSAVVSPLCGIATRTMEYVRRRSPLYPSAKTLSCAV